MILRKSLTSLSAAVVLAASLFVSGCDDTTTPSITIPGAPSNMTALSVSETTVRLKFSASASESNSDFKDYFLTITNGATSNTISLTKGGAWYDISGLSAGKTYTFSLKARTNDTASAAVTIDWATAKRYTNLRAYEKASTLGSGIDLLNGMNQTIASSNLWDLCFDSADSTFGAPGASSFVSGGLIGGKTPKVTYIFAVDPNTPYIVTADSLNAVYEGKAINDTTSTRKKKVEGLVDTKGTKSFVMYALTGDNRFAKILVKAVGGSIVQSDANGAFVEIDASVQTTANIPYALKNNFRGWDDPGVKATQVLHVTTK